MSTGRPLSGLPRSSRAAASPLLSAADLHKSYGDTTTDRPGGVRAAALDGVSFSLDAGEIVAVTGPSGSGKSTLLHCLSGILAPDAGTVSYAGHTLTGMNDARRSALRRADFGFVFQFGQLVPELSCLDNVALPLRLGGAGRRAADLAALEWLERLGVGELRARRPGELSGGQAQRVAVARALVGRPKVLFADEPTGALDSANGARVMDLLVEAARRTGAAVVLVSHAAEVAAYADREVVVRDGRTAHREHAV